MKEKLMSMLRKKITLSQSLRIDHRWLAIIIMIPLLITTVTGLLLILRQQIEWVQPSSIKLEKVEKWVTMDQVFSVISTDAKTKIHQWKDVSSIIYKPSKGTIQIRTKINTLIQLDGATAKILSIAPRRTGLLIQLHEGSYWSKNVRQYIFIPSALGLLLLLISGGILIIKYYSRKLKKR